MLIVMKQDASAAGDRRVVEVIEAMGYEARPMPGRQRTTVGLVGNDGRVDASRVEGARRRGRGHPRLQAVQAGLARVEAGADPRGAPGRHRRSAAARWS